MNDKKKSGIITNIQHFSLHDGPGIRTTVFLKGCQLNCLWCHNPENISAEPEIMDFGEKKASKIVGKVVEADDVINDVIRDKMFYLDSKGGVTFSGGEPTMQFEFLSELLSLCKSNNIHTAIETNLFLPEDKAEEIADKVDLIICDIKMIDSKKHRFYTGVDNELILRNMKRIYDLRKPMIIRIPLISEINNCNSDLNDFLRYFESFESRENISIEILPYHRFGESKYASLGLDYKIVNGILPSGQAEKFLDRIISLGFNASINTW